MVAPKIQKASLLSAFCTIKFNAQFLPCDIDDHLEPHPLGPHCIEQKGGRSRDMVMSSFKETGNVSFV